ncbi:hypothetical protein EDB85DRAFT_2282817 [Lactarius pseudohatsudake]|nr:hypothetical protein EDB85DRAFT_2282817 [Lactarius pseudohatsudake]
MNVLESACVRNRGQRVVKEKGGGRGAARKEWGRVARVVLRVPTFGPDFRDNHTKSFRGKNGDQGAAYIQHRVKDYIQKIPVANAKSRTYTSGIENDEIVGWNGNGKAGVEYGEAAACLRLALANVFVCRNRASGVENEAWGAGCELSESKPMRGNVASSYLLQNLCARVKVVAETLRNAETSTAVVMKTNAKLKRIEAPESRSESKEGAGEGAESNSKGCSGIGVEISKGETSKDKGEGWDASEQSGGVDSEHRGDVVGDGPGGRGVEEARDANCEVGNGDESSGTSSESSGTREGSKHSKFVSETKDSADGISGTSSVLGEEGEWVNGRISDDGAIGGVDADSGSG